MWNGDLKDFSDIETVEEFRASPWQQLLHRLEHKARNGHPLTPEQVVILLEMHLHLEELEKESLN